MKPEATPTPLASDVLPPAVLQAMLEDQKRALRAWGIHVPSDAELFAENTPMAVKVRLFDLMIREAMEADFV